MDWIALEAALAPLQARGFVLVRFEHRGVARVEGLRNERAHIVGVSVKTRAGAWRDAQDIADELVRAVEVVQLQPKEHAA